jgi:hypothetical protein
VDRSKHQGTVQVIGRNQVGFSLRAIFISVQRYFSGKDYPVLMMAVIDSLMF